MITFENGGSVSDLTQPMRVAVLITADIVDWIEQQTVQITSTTSGKHMPGSRHYSGNAVDIRTRGWAEPQAVAEAIAVVLGDDFDVILEADHLHIEHDPK